jgi:hypothetical protein
LGASRRAGGEASIGQGSHQHRDREGGQQRKVEEDLEIKVTCVSGTREKRRRASLRKTGALWSFHMLEPRWMEYLVAILFPRVNGSGKCIEANAEVPFEGVLTLTVAKD